MEVLLFRALTDANIDPDTAQKVVEAVEEHIDMTVGLANKALEAKMDTIILQVDTLNKQIDNIGTTTQTAIANMGSDLKSAKWVSVGVAGLLALVGAAAGLAGQLHL
ncbi:hypothetical protein ACWGNZ_23060 (plasmid) [Sphingomonas zeae]|jgi:hypothetical protein